MVLTSNKINFSDISPINGQIVIQLNTGNSFYFLNNSFIPFVSGVPVNFNNTLTIYINGILRNTQINITDFSINDIINERIDTCIFSYRNEGDINNNIDVGNEVVVFDFDLNKIFSGEIIKMPLSEEWEGAPYILFKVSAIGWRKRLDAKLAVNNYVGLTAKQIIEDMIENFNPEFTTNNVQDGLVFDNISFNFVPIGNAIARLAQIIGFNWYVDINKDIHFFDNETNLAPFIIEPAGNFEKFNFTQDISQIKNKILLEGANVQEFFNNDLQVADGIQTTFRTAYKPFSPISVFVNNGSGFIQRTVGIKNISDSGFDFLIDFNEKTIENLDFPTLLSGDEIKFTYNREIPLISVAEEMNSIEFFKETTGGDGIKESRIKDDTITSFEVAANRIQAEFNDFAFSRITGSFVTNTHLTIKS